MLDDFYCVTLTVRTIDAHNLPEYENMPHIFNENAPKKATNLSINSDLLNKAKGLNVNLSATLENALESVVRTAEKEHWLKENKKAINSLNKLVDEHGLFSDSYREF
ncbi:MAG: type II toxin-antitoxin system CcdA family antitoxin [Thiohalomonadales bacterium]